MVVPVNDNIFLITIRTVSLEYQHIPNTIPNSFTSDISLFFRITEEVTPSRRAIEIKAPPTAPLEVGLWVRQSFTLHNQIAYFVHILIV